MAGCDITPASAKACSGKCRNKACGTESGIWVVAACGGMISLFSKVKQGALLPIDPNRNSVFPSLDSFKETIINAERARAFDQLILIGSGSDLAWIHAALPESVTLHIAAEIPYPLLPAWFQAPTPQLSQALGTILAQ